MKNVLVVLNHQPQIPPFMLTALNCAQSMFDDIFFVNTCFPKFAELYVNNKHIQFYQPSSLQRKKAVVSAALSVLRKDSVRNIKKYIKEKGFNVAIVKSVLVNLTVDACIRPLACGIIKRFHADNITVLSTWFSASAYSASLLKKRFPTIKAVSLAHSYEILVIRNPLVPYLFIDVKHKYLDAVFFIAEAMKEMYLDGVGTLNAEAVSRTHVCHLGSYKKFGVVNKVDPGIFNICTCSRVIPLKRLDLLIEALGKWNNGRLRWTHFGDGVDFEKIKSLSEKLTGANPLVEVDLKGFVPNSEVESHYANQPVDVFINLSTIEGLPISIMEAISYGIPTIATNVGGTKEIVVKDTGVLMPANISSELLLKELQRFNTLSKEDIAKIRSTTYQYWKKNFDAEANLRLLFKQIERL